MHMPESNGTLEDLDAYEPGFYSSDVEETSELDSPQSGPFGPDSSAQLVELGVEDFPLYFSERDNRLFQSSLYSPYPLPVDTAEQQRQNVLHQLLQQLLRSLYVGPVHAVLQNRQALVLDLCTGTGKWVMDMAARFPNSFFRGVDIVPIATRHPPANVQFEMHDVNNRLRWGTSSVDVVHIRDAWMAVKDFSALLQEAGRMLRPGGLLISCEWGQDAVLHPHWANENANLGLNAPSIREFFTAIQTAFQATRSIPPMASSISSLLQSSPLFENVSPQTFHMPIGPRPNDVNGQAMGRAYRAALRRYADSAKHLLYDAGMGEDDVEELVRKFKEELSHIGNQIGGLVSPVYTVHARRTAAGGNS